MRIEILTGSDTPSSYPINKPRVVIGSDESCDVIVDEPEVSRKHLVISYDDSRYFVVDQGSTNGSYLNEERLIPGRRVEFTSFFPIRIGSSVLVSLISDTESSGETFSSLSEMSNSFKSDRKSNPDKTTVLSLKDLNGAKTANLIKNRKNLAQKIEDRTTANANVKINVKGQGKFKIIQVMAILILVVTAYINLFIYGKEDTVLEVASDAAKTDEARILKDKIQLETQNKLKLILENSLDKPKCQTELEKMVCDSIEGLHDPLKNEVSTLGVTATSIPMSDEVKQAFEELEIAQMKQPGSEVSNRGAILDGNEFYILISGEGYLKQAGELLKQPNELPGSPLSKEAKSKYNKDVWKVAIALFAAQAINPVNNFLQLENKPLNFGFVLTENDKPRVAAILSVLPNELITTKPYLEPRYFDAIPKGGVDAISAVDNFFKIYVP